MQTKQYLRHPWTSAISSYTSRQDQRSTRWSRAVTEKASKFCTHWCQDGRGAVDILAQGWNHILTKLVWSSFGFCQARHVSRPGFGRWIMPWPRLEPRAAALRTTTLKAPRACCASPERAHEFWDGVRKYVQDTVTGLQSYDSPCALGAACGSRA